MKSFIFIFLVFMIKAQLGISQNSATDSDSLSANEFMQQFSHEQLASAFESSDRDEWQKPDEVIRFLGDIEDKIIVDLGSGSGYFTFRLVGAGAKVIAADVDENFLEMIRDKQNKLNIGPERLTTLHITENELNIEDGSADIVFMVNVYHHISNRVEYFTGVNAKLKENGRIIIVDFYKKDLPVGPPKNHKISNQEVLEELHKAGFKEMNENTDLLDYQYIITAHKY